MLNIYSIAKDLINMNSFVFTRLLFVPMFYLAAFKYLSNVLEGTY